MFGRKVQLSILVTILSLLAWAAMGQGGEALTAIANQYDTGNTEVSSTPAAGQTQAAPAQGDAKTTADTDSRTAVLQLLEESHTAMKSATDKKMAVHFAEKSYSSIKGESTIYESDGDVILPDRSKMTAEIHLPKREQPYGWDGRPLVVDAVTIGDTLYLKPSFSDTWSVFKITDGSDELVSDVDLEAINFYDYAKSATNMGDEIFPDGTRVHHVSVEIDTPKLIDKIETLMAPDKVQKYGSELDKLKTSTIVTETWIGIDNLLVYRAIFKASNDDLQLADDDTFLLSNWGETVDISAPCSCQ